MQEFKLSLICNHDSSNEATCILELFWNIYLLKARQFVDILLTLQCTTWQMSIVLCTGHYTGPIQYTSLLQCSRVQYNLSQSAVKWCDGSAVQCTALHCTALKCSVVVWWPPSQLPVLRPRFQNNLHRLENREQRTEEGTLGEVTDTRYQHQDRIGRGRWNRPRH